MSETRLVGESRFALMVKGSDLPIDTITEKLGLEPTRVVRKGDLLNRLPEIIADTDEWFHVIRLTEPLGPDSVLTGLLRHLSQRKEALQETEKLGHVSLRLTVQSDYAQMVFCLTHETLRQLADLNLPLDVSSISWGEVGI